MVSISFISENSFTNKQKTPRRIVAVFSVLCSSLGAANVRCSWTLRTLLNIESYSVTLLKIVEADVYESLCVEENVVASISWLDKTEAVWLDAYDSTCHCIVLTFD